MSSMKLDHESLKKALSHLTSVSTKSESLTLNDDEVKSLENAFSDEKFTSILSDYMEEISDPKSRAEKDAYLKVLEEQHEVPLNKKVIHPKSGYVLKFKTREITNGKIFVNIVHSEEIDRPSSKHIDGKGSNWSIPFIIGPKRFELDKKKHATVTYDVCFHSMTVALGATKKDFLNLIVNTTRDALIQHLRREGKGDTIDSSYHILRNVRYINGSPTIMLIPIKDLKGDVEEFVSGAPKIINSNLTGQNSFAHVEEHQEVDKLHLKRSTLKKGFLLKDVNGNRNDNKCDGSITPHYDVIEKGNFDLIDYTIEGNQNLSTRPNFLEYRIFVPSIKSTKQLNLKVTDQRLELSTSPDAPACKNYLLSVKFPYPVIHDNSLAKLNTDTCVLVITLPVVRPEIERLNHHHINQRDTADMITVETNTREENVDLTESLDSVTRNDKTKIKTGAIHSRWIKPDQDTSSTRESFASKHKIPTLEKSCLSDKNPVDHIYDSSPDLCGTNSMGSKSHDNYSKGKDSDEFAAVGENQDGVLSEEEPKTVIDIHKFIFQID